MDKKSPLAPSAAPPKFTKFLLSIETATLARIKTIASKAPAYGERAASRLMRHLIRDALALPQWQEPGDTQAPWANHVKWQLLLTLKDTASSDSVTHARKLCRACEDHWAPWPNSGSTCFMIPVSRLGVTEVWIGSRPGQDPKADFEWAYSRARQFLHASGGCVMETT